MTNVLMQIISQTIAASGAAPWQVAVGQAAGVCILTVLGGVAGWFGHKLHAPEAPLLVVFPGAKPTPESKETT